MKRMLPLGTIVRIGENESEEDVMIFSRLVRDHEDQSKIWDYCGCPIPIGYINEDSIMFFDQSDIKLLVMIGYQNEVELQHATKLGALRDDLSKLNIDDILQVESNKKEGD